MSAGGIILRSVAPSQGRGYYSVLLLERSHYDRHVKIIVVAPIAPLGQILLKDTRDRNTDIHHIFTGKNHPSDPNPPLEKMMKSSNSILFL